MKSDFKAKMLQYFSAKKKGNGGFTLIELLVVIIIIGILSAIALPSFLNQANKARQSEAKTYIGSMNRAQQAYYLETSSFTTQIGLLGLGVASSTDNYEYEIVTPNNTNVTSRAKPQGGNTASVKAYIGGVTVGSAQGTGEATTLAILCEAVAAPINAGANGAQSIVATNLSAPACPTAPAAYKTIK